MLFSEPVLNGHICRSTNIITQMMPMKTFFLIILERGVACCRSTNIIAPDQIFDQFDGIGNEEA